MQHSAGLWTVSAVSFNADVRFRAAAKACPDTAKIPPGPACHTNRHNCFYRAVRGGGLVTIAEPVE
jgi:hypothetical protein